MVELQDFRDEFPEFSAVPAATVKRKIAHALELSAVSRRATLLLAAHLVAEMSATTEAGSVDAGAGVVTSESVGPYKTEYLTQADDDPDRVPFTTTVYGRQFLALESRSPAFVVSARNYG